MFSDADHHILQPWEVPENIRPWYTRCTTPFVADNLPLRKWTDIEHRCLHRYLGAYRGKTNIAGLSSALLKTIIDSFPELKTGLHRFDAKQVRDKLKGWPRV